jgi:hypothetical protein
MYRNPVYRSKYSHPSLNATDPKHWTAIYSRDCSDSKSIPVFCSECMTVWCVRRPTTRRCRSSGTPRRCRSCQEEVGEPASWPPRSATVQYLSIWGVVLYPVPYRSKYRYQYRTISVLAVLVPYYSPRFHWLANTSFGQYCKIRNLGIPLGVTYTWFLLRCVEKFVQFIWGHTDTGTVCCLDSSSNFAFFFLNIDLGLAWYGNYLTDIGLSYLSIRKGLFSCRH